jgi:AcrR family transcriptional regulator
VLLNQHSAGYNSGSIIKESNYVVYATQRGKVTQITEDLRIRRTRKLLLEALMELTVEKGFAAVTVSDITERAMVNRSTFYRHYLDKYDLIDKYMDEVYHFMSNEEFSPEKHNQGEPPSGLVKLLLHIQQFADFYRVMLGPQGDSGFQERMRENTKSRFRYFIAKAGIKQEPDASPIELRLTYISHAGIGAIKWWLEDNQPCTAEQLAVWVSKLGSASGGFW